MIRLVVLLALGLLSEVSAETLSTLPTCGVPADLAPSPDIAAAPLEDLNRIVLPRVVFDLKRNIPVGGQTFGEMLLAQVTIDSQGGSITFDNDGKLFASSSATCKD